MTKTAIVTGATGGIGQEIARRLAHLGYNLVLTYNANKEGALALYRELSPLVRVEVVQLDLANMDAVAETAQNITKLFPTIDLLVNNAGIAEKGLFTDLSNNSIIKMVNTTLTGTMIFTREIVAKMLRTETGTIVNVSSIWGEVGASMEVHYSAAKAGLIGFSKALSKELAPMGIRVNAVAPGAIDTPMLDSENKEELTEAIPLQKLGTPKDVADAVLYLASAQYVTGTVLSVNGGGIL